MWKINSYILRAVKFSAKLMSKALAKRQKAVILYATETGKSERYAKMLGQLFSHAFDPKVSSLPKRLRIKAYEHSPAWVRAEI